MEGGYFDQEAIDAERFDADMEQAELERRGNRIAELRRKGICVHGWVQGTPGVDNGPVRCLEEGCGESWDSETAYENAREGVMARWM